MKIVDVSIIVPTLNEEKFIKQCLSSIVNQQTSLDMELIVVDGQSKDKTLDIAKNYADRVIVLKKE